MITVCCRFAHYLKIMRIPQTVCFEVFPPRTVQRIISDRGGEGDVLFTRCIEGRDPKVFELWAFAEDKICEVHLFDRFQIRDNFTEDTFYSHFFNARQIQIPFLGHRSVNWSVRWLDVTRPSSQAGSRVATWTEKNFVYSWVPYPTVIPPNVSIIRRRAIENVPINPHNISCRPIMNAFDWFVLSGDNLLRGSSTREFSRTFVIGPMRPPMTMAGLKIPTPTDKLRTLLTMWVSAIG